MFRDVLLLMVSMTTLCQGSRIVISAKPATITEGETPTFSVRCYLENDATSGNRVSRVSSIIIKKGEGEGEVARISTGKAAVAGPAGKKATVLGSLVLNSEYLEATWTPPVQAQSGTYICDIQAVDADNISVALRSNIKVGSTGPPDNDLAKSVAQNKKDIEELRKLLSDLQANGIARDQKAIAQCCSKTDDLKTEVNDLKTKINSLSLPHTEQGLVVCRNSDSWGQKMQPRETTVDVRFSTPYSKNPIVDIYVIKLDVNHEFNTRYRIDIKDLTTTGFKVLCGTWWDAVVYEMIVRWTSFVE